MEIGIIEGAITYSVASPICQEGQSERTFPILAFFFPVFPLFLDFFPDFSSLFPDFFPIFPDLWQFFRCQEALCPLAPILAMPLAITLILKHYKAHVDL